MRVIWGEPVFRLTASWPLAESLVRGRADLSVVYIAAAMKANLTIRIIYLTIV